VYERSFYLDLHRLRDDPSSAASLTNRLRDAKALYYEEHDESDVRSAHGLGVPDEWTQIDQLRSAIIQTRKRRAGRKSVMWLLFAVVIVIALVLTGIVGWVNF
jgi:hypothetical protein